MPRGSQPLSKCGRVPWGVGYGDARMANETPGTVRIRLLGPVELVADDVDLAGIKQPLLLSLLAVRPGEVVPTDALVDVLWGEAAPADPVRSLQVHISNLRRALAAAELDATIDHRQDGYVLRIDPGAIDLGRFEDLVERGIAALDEDPEQARTVLGDALALWRGRPLRQVDDHPSLRPVVIRLEDLRLRAVEARIDADLRTGHHDEVVDELQELTRQHPLREGLWGRFMLALYRSERQAEALEAYETARRHLVDELGIDPAPALRELHGRILQQDPELDAAPAEVQPAASSPPPQQRSSLAVLPLEVFGGTEDASLLAVGLHNDLLTELSKVPGLTVISRTSVIGYRGTDRSVPRIARELNVAAVAEGTLQSAGRRFRLTIQLIDGRRDVHLWAENYDSELTTENLFAVQSDLAREIARSLTAELAPAETVAEGPATGSLPAYRIAAKARQQYELRTEDGMRRAIELYEEALDLDPEYADAWVGLADALTMMDGYGHGDRHQLLPAAERAVHRALALDPDSAGAHTSLGLLHIMHQDGPAAIRELERAIELQPSYADAHNLYSWLLLLIGRAEAGFEAATRTVELDPLSAEPMAHVALGHAALEDAAGGLQAVRRARRFSSYTTADLYEGICLYELGRYREAVEVLEPLTVGTDGELGVPWAGHGPDATFALSLAGLGDVDGARDILDHIDRRGFPFAAGLVHLAVGELEEAAGAFRRVDHLSAWPCLVIHHYHRDVWNTMADTDVHRDLVRTAYRAWGLDPPT